MFYHASRAKGIEILQPRISNHNVPLIYFSRKRENVLVYLSNAIEKCCIEANFEYSGIWKKWGSYGFDKNGIQRIEEYYPNALADTYSRVDGYIYYADHVDDCGFQTQIPDAVTSDKPVVVSKCEYISEAYEAILAAEKNQLVRIVRYDEMSEGMHKWLERTIREEYENASEHPDYCFFLEQKFGNILK